MPGDRRSARGRWRSGEKNLGAGTAAHASPSPEMRRAPLPLHFKFKVSAQTKYAGLLRGRRRSSANAADVNNGGGRDAPLAPRHGQAESGCRSHGGKKLHQQGRSRCSGQEKAKRADSLSLR